ncbi:hypothetical protein ASD31_24560 [Rhizobium sp. Root482]|nr:hypothetical protein ASD31_24560 [Rhizobium sp. Root482]
MGRKYVQFNASEAKVNPMQASPSPFTTYLDRTKLEALLARSRPREVALAEYKKSLEEAYKNLLSAIRDIPNNRELEVFTARCELKMERWHSAAIRWAEISRGADEYRAEAYMSLAVIYRNLGAYSKAFSFVKTAESRGAGSDEVRREYRRLRRKMRGSAASALASEASVSLTAENLKEAQSLLIPAMRLAGVPVAVQSAVDAFLESEPPIHCPVEEHVPRVIFVGGFGWSGSGAVTDYLCQHPSVTLPFGHNEALLFSETEGTIGVAQKVPGTVGGIPLLQNHLLRAVYGVIPREAGDIASGRGRSVFWQDQPDPQIVSQITAAALRLVKADWREMEKTKVIDCVVHFYSSVLAALIPRGRIGVTSNCITAANMEMVRYVTGGFGVAAFRDPRDQYVAQRYEHRSGNTAAVDRFISKLRKRLRAFERAEKRLGPSKIIRCQFEDFVRSAKYRASFLGTLGVHETEFKFGEGGYRPEDSLGNLGLFKSYAAQEEIRKIEEAFPALLVL